jgi:hypothetical protein
MPSNKEWTRRNGNIISYPFGNLGYSHNGSLTYNQPSSRHGKQLSFFSPHHLQWRKDRWLPHSSFSQEPKGIMATWREKNEIKTTKEKNGGKKSWRLQHITLIINESIQHKTIHIFSVLPEKTAVVLLKFVSVPGNIVRWHTGFFVDNSKNLSPLLIKSCSTPLHSGDCRTDYKGNLRKGRRENREELVWYCSRWYYRVSES